MTFSQRIYVQSGDTVFVRLGASEMCMRMGLVGKVRPVTISEHRAGFGNLLGPTGHPSTMPSPLGWMGFYHDRHGWYSHDIAAAHVACDPTAAAQGPFCCYTEGRRTDDGTRRYETVRDAVQRARATGTHAELRYVETTGIADYPGWVTSTPLPLDLKVHEQFSAQGTNCPTWTTVSCAVVGIATAIQAEVTAARLAKHYGHGRAYRDTFVSLPTHPKLFAGRYSLVDL